jgi:hypothetical protein
MQINRGIRLNFSPYKGVMTLKTKKTSLCRLLLEKEVTRTEMRIVIRTIANLVGIMILITNDKADKEVVATAGVILKVALMVMVKSNNLKSPYGVKSKVVLLTQTMKKIC